MALIRLILSLFASYLLAVLVLSFLYLHIPPATPLMVANVLTGMKREWVPLERISPNLIRAVIVSEDARFCEHHGIDWKAVDKALDQGARRGASTITMQTAKNLFLWNGRSWLRKALEAPLALWIDLIWPKRRILEVYLNIAEWGDGVFGIEAAARREFGLSAAELNAGHAALLATMLPDPKDRSAGAPGPYQQGAASKVMAHAGGADTRCLR